MMKWQKETSVRAAQAADMTHEELQGKIVIGEFVNTQCPEYGEILRSFLPESGEGDNA
jgi:2-oxoglutarate ferredoxin oxidoreductase subunit beta